MIDKKIQIELDQIHQQLDSIGEMFAWMIKADQRFRVGQRVEWSRKGLKGGFARRKQTLRGTVKGIDLFSVVVKLDGVKKETSYHHSFFNPLNGQKLF